MDGWVFRSSNDGEENYSDSYGTTRSSSGCLEEFKSDTSFSESFEIRSISSSGLSVEKFEKQKYFNKNKRVKSFSKTGLVAIFHSCKIAKNLDLLGVFFDIRMESCRKFFIFPFFVHFIIDNSDQNPQQLSTNPQPTTNLEPQKKMLQETFNQINHVLIMDHLVVVMKQIHVHSHINIQILFVFE